MEATFLLGVTLYYRGDFVGARAQYDRALAEFDDRQRNRLWAGRVGEDAGVTHRCYLALALWQLGQPEQALRVNREARELALAIEHPFSIAYAYHHTSWLYQMMRLPAETLVFSDEQMQISAEQGFPLFSATAAIYSSAGKILQGRLEHAVEELEAGLDSYRDTGAGLALPYYLGLLADALIRTGKYRDAQSALDEALLIVDASGDRCYEAELHRLRGDLARQEGADDAAEASYLRAREIARTQWSKAWELRTSTSLARLYVARGSRGQGFDVLSRLCVDFDDFITPDLRDAKALLRELQSA
jgi:tetratricopeptide (TPR) repeat protein